MSNTATVITTKAGEALIAQMQAENKVLVIDKFIFANVPNRPTFPDRDDVVPVEHVVHESAVHEQGRLTENSVIYSTTLASNVGPFSFNWSGLFCSEHNVLVAINFPPPVDKTFDAPGITGNTLVRSFVLEYKGISETTNITVDPSSWQYDAHKRMSKMDNDTAQAIIDQNGKDWFIDDGFIVTPQSGAYSIKAGAGYVSGHRISLDFDRIIQVPEKPAFIYVDAFREGSPTGEWQTKFTFVVSADEKDDYADAQGVNHFVCKIAQVFEDGSVGDMRAKGESASRGFVVDNDKQQAGMLSGHRYRLVGSVNSLIGQVVDSETSVELIDYPDVRQSTLFMMNPTPKTGWVVCGVNVDLSEISFTDQSPSKLVPLNSKIKVENYGFGSDALDAAYNDARKYGVELVIRGKYSLSRSHVFRIDEVPQVHFDAEFITSKFGDVDDHKVAALLIYGYPIENRESKYSGNLRVINDDAICHGVALGGFESGQGCGKFTGFTLFTRGFSAYQRCGFIRNDGVYGTKMESVTAHANYHNIVEGGNENYIGKAVSSGCTGGWSHYCGSTSYWKELNDSKGMGTAFYVDGHSNGHGLTWVEANAGKGGLIYTGKLNDFGVTWVENNKGINVCPLVAHKLYRLQNTFKTLQIDCGEERDDGDKRTPLKKLFLDGETHSGGDIYNSLTITKRGSNPADFSGGYADYINGELPDNVIIPSGMYWYGGTIRKTGIKAGGDNAYMPSSVQSGSNVLTINADRIQDAIDSLPDVINGTINIKLTSSATKPLIITGSSLSGCGRVYISSDNDSKFLDLTINHFDVEFGLGVDAEIITLNSSKLYLGWRLTLHNIFAKGQSIISDYSENIINYKTTGSGISLDNTSSLRTRGIHKTRTGGTFVDATKFSTAEIEMSNLQGWSASYQEFQYGKVIEV
ncbi:hypothetical protein C0W42_08460 [Photobacterium kishitanii]|uniref:phage tail-collar fiber domain-containing protein n=1 Tax=Photobacterium kishitanii TaxID=318456 RepID=UPI000D1653EA|nr:phage tail protein [Photobacterium kishitanii]PSU89818.1 hypothetical protein C0W42_08460 [Photobacterium kishitanii]